MKRIVTMIMSMFVLLVAAGATEYNFTDAGVVSFDGLLTYKIDHDKYCVNVQKVTEAEEVVIEDVYKYGGLEYKVVCIGGVKNGGFNMNIFGGQQNATVKKISLGASVEEILSRAFAMLKGLEELVCAATTPPTAAKDIFASCTNLKSIVVPAGCEEAYRTAWDDCIPEGVEVKSDKSTAVEGVEVAEFSLKGCQLICGEPQNVEVYAITGSIIFKGYASVVELPQAGVYIVKVGDSVKKINCR